MGGSNLRVLLQKTRCPIYTTITCSLIDILGICLETIWFMNWAIFLRLGSIELIGNYKGFSLLISSSKYGEVEVIWVINSTCV